MKAALAAFLVAASLGLLNAQGTKPHQDPTEYSAHAQVGPLQIGADLLGHNIPLDHTTLDARGYIVVEIALYAPTNSKIAINANQFTLKVNGQLLAAVPASVVTIGYAFPEMRDRNPRAEVAGGVGPVIVTDGRDPRQPRFPGDDNPADGPPLPPKPGTADEGLQKDPVDPVEAVKNAALPEGAHATPISGYLFYNYTAKLKHVKHAELEYASATGTASLTLR